MDGVFVCKTEPHVEIKDTKDGHGTSVYISTVLVHRWTE